MTFFVEANFLLLLAYGLWLLLDRFAWKVMRPTQFLGLSKLLVVTALALPMLTSLLPRNDFIEPAVHVWSEGPALSSKAAISSSGRTMRSVVGSDSVVWGNLRELEKAWLFLMLAFAMMMAARFVWNMAAIKRVLRGAHLLRKVGSVRVLIHDGVLVPFSFWIPGRAYVVLPSSYLESLSRYRIAVLHELQHHRQGDTRAAYLFQLLRAFFPAACFMERAIAGLQEFACDEALVAAKSVSPHAYGGCLIEAAELGLRPGAVLAGTASMAAGVSAANLKRRISMMFEYRSEKRSRLSSVVIGTLVMACMATAAMASQGLVRDRRVSIEDAKKMASGSALPIVVNDAVLEQLNYYVGTPGGKKHMRESLGRMAQYKAMIAEKMTNYNVPEELMAIPIIESGFQNIRRMTRSQQHGSVAGLWMFIEPTARHYNLSVVREGKEFKRDDRLNEELETDAAMRLLSADFLRFQDWHLALLAYNVGESYVQRGIERTGARNAWKIIEAAKYSEKDYLPKLMAAILVMKNPGLLD